jgi:hypothetical protein
MGENNLTVSGVTRGCERRDKGRSVQGETIITQGFPIRERGCRSSALDRVPRREFLELRSRELTE